MRLELHPLSTPPPWRVVVRGRRPLGAYQSGDGGWWLVCPILRGLVMYRLGMGRPEIWGKVIAEEGLFLFAPHPAGRRGLEEVPGTPLSPGERVTLVWPLAPRLEWMEMECQVVGVKGDMVGLLPTMVGKRRRR